jgi:hypothetical protein
MFFVAIFTGLVSIFSGAGGLIMFRLLAGSLAKIETTEEDYI